MRLSTHIRQNCTKNKLNTLFESGPVFVSGRVLETYSPEVIDAYLAEYFEGHWGELSDMADANEIALLDGGPIVSRRADDAGKACYIVTEADRSKTTILMEDEYEQSPFVLLRQGVSPC